MRRASFALLIALAACRGSDPYAGVYSGGSCLVGSARDPGPGCTSGTIATLVVDGVADEWQGDILAFPHPADCFQDGDACAVYAARDGDTGLAFFLPTAGPPTTDGSAAYLIWFRREGMYADEPGNVYVELWVTPSGVSLELGGDNVLWGIPVDYAFGPDGVEVRIPVDAFPYPGSAILIGGTDRGAGISVPAFASVFCFDTTLIDGPCSFF